MKTVLHKLLSVLFLSLLSCALFAQTAPNISYTSPQTFTAGTSVGTISPTNSGGTVPATATYTVSTFAGTTGTSGLFDGTGTGATFNQPRGLSSDAAGNLYVTEISNNGIRKITPGAVVTLFAGSATGTSGSANGTGTSAYFFNPYDITTDPSGNFYVADYSNNLIRKITPAGVVTTYATVTRPSAIIYDSFSGSFVVSRFTTNDLVKVSLSATTGVVSTFVGSGTAGNANGTGTAASFNGPNGLTDDGNGNIYVADQANNEIRKINAAGTVTTFAGSTAGTAGSTDGTGTNALFNSPRSLVTDAAGNIYVSDANNYLLRMITPSGVVTTIAGSGVAGSADGVGTSASFNGLRGLQVDAVTGYIYLADITNHTIRKIIPSGYKITGTLPAGLSFNTNTGVISGTPTATSPTTTYTITATNSYGSSITTTTIAVGPAVTTPAAICGAGTVATMTASGGSPAGGVYNWYTSATGGTLVNTGATYTPTLATTTTFYVDYTVSGSTTPRTAVTATINPTVSSPNSNASIAYSFSGDTRDVSGNQNDGILKNAPTLTTDRYGASSAAFNFNGTNQWIGITKQVTDPQTFTISAWFNTTTTTGGRIVGFSGGQDGGGQFDRHIYMNNAGQLYFGVYVNGYNTVNTTASYNNGQWHHVVATLSAANGMKLYVDNVLQASNAAYTSAEPHNGYWNIGGNQISGWPSAPASAYFSGKIDDVSIFTVEQTAATVTASNNLNIIGAYAPVCLGSPLTIYTPTVTGATYTWTDPNGTVVTSTTNSATFAAAVVGSYTLSVTGGPGGCTSTATYTPTVSALPTAAFTANAAVDVNASTAITLTSTVDPNSTYTWSFGGGTPASGTGSGPFNVKWATTGLKTVTLTVTNATGCSATFTKTVAVGAASFSGYAFKKQLTLNTISAGITTDQTNFPALVYIQDNNLIVTNNCNNKVQYPLGNYNGPAGTNYDFAFLDPTTSTELNYQVENYNSTTGTLLVWVQIPKLYAANNNTLSFYFGSLTPAHTATFYNNTWASDYLAVYHFNETSGTVLDATNNAVNGTPTNITAATDKIHTAAGLTGGGYNFSKASGSKIITSKKADITANAFTLSAWISVTTPGNDNKIVSNELNFGPGYKMAAKTNAIETETRSTNTIGSEGNLGRGGTITTGWHYIQGTFNGTAFINYLDGVAVTTSLLKTATSLTPLAGDVVAIGIDHRSGTSDENFYDGLMDEVRISNVIKSADWIKAEYVNQTTPLTFTDYSAAVTVNHTNAAAIPGALLYTWNGANSTDPALAGNWTNTTEGVTSQLPNANASVNVPVLAGSNYPKLTAPLAIYGLTVAQGSNFDLNNQTLTVGCNIYNSGRINTAGVTNTSTLAWNGTFTPQLYIGNTTTSNTAQFGNFTVANTATSGQVKLSGGPVDIYNTLTLTSGSLAVDNTTGSLTLKSTSTSTARVAAITSATQSITGNVTVERWFTGGALSNRGWRLMSSPVNNTSTLPATASAMFNFTSLKTNLNITGSGTNFDASANNGPTILFYNTSTRLFTWPSDPTVTTNKVGSGFYFYFRGARTGNNKLVKSGGSYPVPETNVVGLQTGVLNQQSFTYTLSNANAGFNQVGNPYPSSISLVSGSGSGSGTPYVGTTGFVYTYVSNANSITTSPSPAIIASGQGFFVKSNSATSSITFTESLKVAGQASPFLLGKPVGVETPMISLKMVQDSANYDVAYVRFLDTYKRAYDEMEDADDMNGLGQNVFFGAMTNDSHLVAIASQPIEKQQTSVFLSVNDNYSGLYSIQKIDITGIPAVYDVWLKDHFKNDSLDLRANSVYKFNLDKTNPLTYGSTRFELVIRKKSLPPYQLISFTGKRTGTDVTLSWNTLNEYDYTSFELQRSTDGINFEAVRNMQSSSLGNYTFKDVYGSPAATKVYYRLKQTDINDNVTYSDIIIISTEGDGTLSLYPNPASNVIQYRLKDDTKATSVRLKIFNIMGVLMKNSTFTTLAGQQDISSLTPGSYTIEISDNNNKKVLLTGKFIKL